MFFVDLHWFWHLVPQNQHIGSVPAAETAPTVIFLGILNFNGFKDFYQLNVCSMSRNLQ